MTNRIPGEPGFSRTHGAYALINRGPDALDPVQVSRLQELRALVSTHPGRLDARVELTARTMLVVELMWDHLREQREAGKSVLSSTLIDKLATWTALVYRLLDRWPKEGEGAIQVGDVIAGMREYATQLAAEDAAEAAAKEAGDATEPE